jgi:hypothetical protein
VPGPDAPVDATPGVDATLPANTGSLLFDGVDDFAFVSATAGLSGYPGITIEAWVKPTATGGARAMVAKDGGDVTQYGLEQDDVTGDARFAIAGTGGDCSPFGAGTVFVADQWIHIAGTWATSPTGRPRLYVNGQLVTIGCETDMIDVLGDLVFGAARDGDQTSRHFAGYIDEVRVWNIERTMPEIRATMNRALFGDESGLIGYWNFEEGTGDVAGDASLNGNDARLGAAIGPDDADPTWSTDTPFD